MLGLSSCFLVVQPSSHLLLKDTRIGSQHQQLTSLLPPPPSEKKRCQEEIDKTADAKRIAVRKEETRKPKMGHPKRDFLPPCGGGGRGKEEKNL